NCLVLLFFALIYRPLLALGYPLCASVQAIETDSYKETRDLISYWILLSLIYLFEYAFSRLLQCWTCIAYEYIK
ncbi:HVA22-like protein a, partial [Mucuna pruriens]